MNVLNVKIEFKKDSLINDMLLEFLFEFFGLFVFFLLYIGFKDSFDWIIVIIFGVIFLIAILLTIIINVIPNKNYLIINTKNNIVEIKKLNKIKKYSLDNIRFKSIIYGDDEFQFSYQLKLYYNNKLVFIMANSLTKNPSFSTKEFYETLKNYITIEERYFNDKDKGRI